MKCTDYIHILSEYLEDDLDKSKRVLVEKHISECKDCRAFFKSFSSSLELVDHLKDEPCPPVLEQKLKNLLHSKLNGQKKNKDKEEK